MTTVCQIKKADKKFSPPAFLFPIDLCLYLFPQSLSFLHGFLIISLRPASVIYQIGHGQAPYRQPAQYKSFLLCRSYRQAILDGCLGA